MTKKIYIKLLVVIQIMVLGVMLISCEKDEKKDETGILLKQGAFVDEKDNYKTFNENDEGVYKEIDTNGKIINSYNLSSNTYTFFKDNSFYVNYNSEDIKINHDKIANLKISPNGEYIFYFINDEYLIPAVMNLKQKKEILLENKALISGQFIDWITNEKLAFYGVDTDKKTTGIFTYDISDNSEENLYKINNGFVKFLKHIKDGVALVEEHYEESTVLKVINIDYTVKEISNEVIDINDVEEVNGNLYLLGRVKNNNFSIYEISDNGIKRLIFDFPNILYVDKGLSVNEDGEILFIGSAGEDKKEYIYKYSDGTVTLVDKDIDTCNFININ